MARPDIIQKTEALPADEAEKLLTKHLKRRPRDADALVSLGALLQRQGRLQELAARLVTLARSPGTPVEIVRLAIDACAAGRDHRSALAIAVDATARHEDDETLWKRRGQAELAMSQAAHAAKSFKRAHVLAPDDNAILAALADADLSSGAFPLPDHYAKLILEREPDVAGHHARLGTAHRFNNRLEEAESCFRRAIELDPQLPTAHAGLAETLESLGRSEEASQVLQPVMEAGDPSFAAVLAWGRVRQRLGDRDSAIKAMERYLASKRGLPMHRSKMSMQLGLAYEKAGRPDDAFRCWQQGNAMHRGRWSPAAHEQLVDSMVATFTRSELERLPRAADAPFTPILVVGMYRSGTTLTEQILSAHPTITPGGESPAMPSAVSHLATALGGRDTFPGSICNLTASQAEEAAEVYRSRIMEHAGMGSHIVDKLPMNYLNIGIAALLLPNARVLHLVCDPLDTAISCYSQAFASQMSFTADLEHLGHAIAQQRRIMAHWADVIDLPMMEVRYETLAAEPESTLRGVLEFLELPWDDAVMRFHESKRVAATPSMDQVRRPINTSAVNRAAAFAEHLQPLRDALGTTE